MSSEIYNNNYGKSLYNLRLNSLAFSSSVRGKLWVRNNPDAFERTPVEEVPIETKSKIFSNELIRLIEKRELNSQKVQQAIKKYLPNTDVKIISMNDYNEFGINTKKNVAAATRPLFDKSGKLQKLDIYLPEVNYGDEMSEKKYIENLTHEMTHAMQFAEARDVRENYKNTPEGHFYNFFQQNITGMLIDTIISDTLAMAARSNKVEMTSLADYDKFLEMTNPNIDETEICSQYKCSDIEEFNHYIKIGFDTYLSGLMNQTQVSKDPFALKVIEEAGGIANFKHKVMQMVSKTLADEKEAYKAGSNARKTARGFVGSDYNDLVPLTIGMMSEALSA